jgi:hypothetical protein
LLRAGVSFSVHCVDPPVVLSASVCIALTHL